MKNLLTPIEVSEMLGIKITTVYDWVYRKKIDVVKVGRLIRFEQDTIENFIKSNSVKGGI